MDLHSEWNGPTLDLPRSYTPASTRLHRIIHGPTPYFQAATPDWPRNYTAKRLGTPVSASGVGRDRGRGGWKVALLAGESAEIATELHRLPRNYTISTRLHAPAAAQGLAPKNTSTELHLAAGRGIPPEGTIEITTGGVLLEVAPEVTAKLCRSGESPTGGVLEMPTGCGSESGTGSVSGNGLSRERPARRSAEG